MALPRPNMNADNISTLPTVMKEQASDLKAKFDKVGVDLKTYLTALIDAMESDGAVLKLNGMAPVSGNITIEDGGFGTIGVQVDPVTGKIRLSATGTEVPAAHGASHLPDGIDPMGEHAASHAIGESDVIPIESIFPNYWLWVYTMYPDILTPGQKALIEGDATLMGIYEASRTSEITDDINEIQNVLNDNLSISLLQEITVSTAVAEISITPPDYTGYKYLKLVIMGSFGGGAALLKMRFNHNSTAGIYDYNLGSAYVAGTQTEIPLFPTYFTEFYLNINLGKFVSTLISGVFFAFINSVSVSSSRYGGFSANLATLESIQIYTPTADRTISAGTKIKIYGVKA